MSESSYRPCDNINYCRSNNSISIRFRYVLCRTAESTRADNGGLAQCTITFTTSLNATRSELL